MTITFEMDFLHAIVAWEEQTQSGFGTSEMLTTRAVRIHVMNSAYWEQHGVGDAILKKELGLDERNY